MRHLFRDHGFCTVPGSFTARPLLRIFAAWIRTRPLTLHNARTGHAALWASHRGRAHFSARRDLPKPYSAVFLPVSSVCCAAGTRSD